PRYNLRSLLFLLAVLPPLLWFGWTKYEAWRAERAPHELLRQSDAFALTNEVLRAQALAEILKKAAANEAAIQAREGNPSGQPDPPPSQLIVAPQPGDGAQAGW